VKAEKEESLTEEEATALERQHRGSGLHARCEEACRKAAAAAAPRRTLRSALHTLNRRQDSALWLAWLAGAPNLSCAMSAGCIHYRHAWGRRRRKEGSLALQYMCVTCFSLYLRGCGHVCDMKALIHVLALLYRHSAISPHK